MIELLPAPDHVFAVRIDGTLTADDYDRMVGEIEAKLARHERIGVYADAVGFSDITAEAAGKDMRYVLGKIGQWKRFAREAVVTDKEWLKTLVKVADPLLPQLEARSFAPAEREAAMAWVADIPH